MAETDTSDLEKYRRKTFGDSFMEPKTQAAMENIQQYSRTSPKNQGIRWGEVAMDAAQTPIDLAKAIWGAASNAPELLKNFNSELEASEKQPMSRKLKNVGAGFGQFGDILNQAPANIRDYFIRKGASEDFGSWVGRPEKNNWQDFFGLGEQQPGDTITQGMGKAIPGALLSGGGAIPASIVGGLHEAGENRNPLTPALGLGATNLAMRGYRGIQSARGANLAPEVLEARNAARAQSTQNYNNFNQETQQAGVNQAYRAPTIAAQTQERVLDSVPGAFVESFENYVNNGQRFEDALQSVSDLRAYASRIRNMVNATPEQNAAMRAANEAANRLDAAANRALDSAGTPALRNNLAEIRRFHADEVIPYKANAENFNLFARDRINPEVLIDDLLKNPEFMHMLSERFPGFQNRNRIDFAKTLAKGTGIGGAALGAGAGYNALFGGNE